MFSLFVSGITDTKCSKFIGFNDLNQIIRNNPNADKIAVIRNLRKNGDDYYKELKSELPHVTPSCMTKVRNLDNDQFDQNFIQFSQYLYFDIDKWNAEEYKSYFINQYGHLVSMVCLSSSGGGISVLFKVKNALTKENFLLIWETVRDTILKDERVDNNCKGIGRAMFISHDPLVFYNYENEIEVEIKNPDPEVESDKIWGKQYKTCKDFNNRLISPFSFISIDKILEKVITRTIVPVNNSVVDFKPVECVEFYIPKIIRDGTKHDIYTRMIHTLVHLNPTLEREYIFSYMFYINNRFAKPKMEKREFIRWFNMVYESVKNSGKTVVTKELRFIHFNPNCNLNKKEKNNIANMLNGCKRKNGSIKKIQDAKIELRKMGQKITQKRISELSGLSPKTVRAHFNSPMIDMDEMVDMVNNSVPVKSFPDKILY
jgi:hypothetical protein